MLTGNRWIDTIIYAALFLGVPGFIVWRLFRRPVEGPVPRDSLASRGKAESRGLGYLGWPSRSYRETLRDEADDSTETTEREERERERRARRG